MTRTEHARTGSVALAALGAIVLGIYVVKAALPFSLLTLDRPLLAFAGITGQNWPGVYQYLLTLGLPFLLYAAGFLVLWRWQVSAAVVATFAVLFGLALFPVYPLTALDVFLYGSQAWIFVHHGANPLIVSPNAFSDNPFLPWAPFGSTPSVYGPLWVYLSSLAVLAGGGHPIGTVLAFKAIGLAMLLASMGLCYRVAERLHRGAGVIAAYTLGWNPLVLWDTVANGHNDMAMVALILLGCLLLFDWPLLALVAIVLAGLVKYAALLLVPVFLLYLLRRRYPLPRLALAVGSAAVCAGLVFRPLWAGPATIAALTEQLEHKITMSPAAALVFWARGLGYSPDAARYLMGSLFAASYALTLLTVNKRIQSAFAASFFVLFALLVLATFWFRSWYIVWPLALAALLTADYKWAAAAGITFSGAGLLIYLFTDYLWVWYGTDLTLHQFVVETVFLPPLMVLCAGAIAALLPSASRRAQAGR